MTGKLAVAVLGGFLFAASASAETLEERVERLEQELRSVKSLLQAQSSAPKQDEASAKPSEAPPIVKASAKDGFSIQSADKAYQIKLRGFTHVEGRYFVDDEPGASTFLVRRIRPIIEGTVAKDYNFRIMPDFGNGTTALLDGYIDANWFGEQAKFRVGKFKAPVSLERLQSINDDPFVETGYPASSLLPNRETGVMVFGDLAGGTISYAASFGNGAAGGANIDTDTEDDKEAAFRLFSHPFKLAEVPALKNLGVGVAATVGHQDGALTSYRSAGQQTIFAFQSGTSADGRRLRIVPQAYYYVGPFGALGEFALTSEDYKRSNAVSELDTYGWVLGASYFLTGEENSYKPVKVLRPLNLAENSWGAVELKARYSGLWVDKDAFTNLALLTASTQRADEFTLGVNWHFNQNVKWLLDYAHTGFSGGSSTGDREDESVVLTRLQLVY